MRRGRGAGQSQAQGLPNRSQGTGLHDGYDCLRLKWRGLFSGAVSYVRGGDCPQLDVSDPEAEWISFDCCTGIRHDGGLYHYHFPPSCLIAQAEADAPLDGGHSPHIGWAQDGFPIYGPLGPDGIEIRNCGAPGAHATYCQDECGGYEGELPGIDAFKYRYYITGKVGDLESLPSNPKPDGGALLPVHAPLPPWRHSRRVQKLLEDGYTSAHKPVAHGYGMKKNPVKCADGKEKTGLRLARPERHDRGRADGAATAALQDRRIGHRGRRARRDVRPRFFFWRIGITQNCVFIGFVYEGGVFLRS